MNSGARVEPTPPECALAAEMFDHFCAAGSMKLILALHREICETLSLKPNKLTNFYPKVKEKLASSWRAQALFKKFDARANHKVYAKGTACSKGRVLIIGAGPCGLRAAIECQLLGAKVVVVEKRDRMSRNNVLHLWPFVIQDLKALGAKKFFGKFCAGSIDHISIRQLQCILMKVALLLGVEIHEGVSFEELLEPTVSDTSPPLGWRARVLPADHPVSQYEFDVLLGADGRRNTLTGFKRKEFRGKLAMAITVNFINRHTEEEAAVPEISGVSYIFNQKFFNELNKVTGIDLENIVYYKDDTHYFVMTAKKHSLLNKGVLLKDYNDVTRLLSVENVDRGALIRYAQEAARFSTDGRLPLRDFALNHYGEPDVALFDFTSMFAAENASMVYERRGYRLLCQLVGDSLLEPFWPTGSGCARGFLSAMDAAWAVRSWGLSPTPHPLEVVAERESIYRLLAQTNQQNLHRDFGAYTLEPSTRYPNLNRRAVTPHRVTAFYDSDDPLPLDATPSTKKRRREADVTDEVLISWVGCEGKELRAAVSPEVLEPLLRRYRPDLVPADEETSASDDIYHVLHRELGIAPFSSGGTMRDVSDAKIRSYLTRVYNAFKGEVPHIQYQSNAYDQIKQNIQEKQRRHTNVPGSPYSCAGDTDKSPSSSKRKRRSPRTPQVSTDPAEYIRKKIGKLDLNDISQLARLIDGHDTANTHEDKQKDLQEQIIALLDPEESPDPKVLRESLALLLQGSSKTNVQWHSKLANFFQDKKSKPFRPPRRLKGLAANTIKVPNFDFDDSADTDATIIKAERVKPETKQRNLSESPLPQRGRRPSDVPVMTRHSESPEVTKRSHSIGASEAHNTQRIAQLFEGNKRKSPEPRSVRSGSLTNEMSLRLQRMSEIIEGKRRDTPSPDRFVSKPDSIGNPELEIRKQRMVDLINAQHKPIAPLDMEMQRRGSGEMSFRMQRVSEIMQKRNAEAKRPKTGGRRKAAREIMKQRFEKSVQMLAAEPRMEVASADLENDYGLQQYRASAPQFDERVRKLERQLQHYEEGRIVSGGGKKVGRGVRVAQLAAELSGTSSNSAMPGPSKPKDLMRSVGKIDRDDWNMKEIERKIQENRLGRPERKAAERVPKWDREQFLRAQRRLTEGGADEKWGEIDETLQKFDQKQRDVGRPDQGTKNVALLAKKFVKKDSTSKRTKSEQGKEKPRKSWHVPPTPGVQCAMCRKRVFAAEGVTADGLHLHRACFRCAVCKATLRPGHYIMERFMVRRHCQPHPVLGVDSIDKVNATPDVVTATPECNSIKLNDDAARESDEDEWANRNFLASDTLAADGLGNYAMMRYARRLVCLRHAGVDGANTANATSGVVTSTPERISIELSDSGAKEIDEDEWTDRNFLASETSGAGGLSDEEESSSEEYTDAGDSDNEEFISPVSPLVLPSQCMYFSDDSFGYDEYSDDGAESSGNESCSRMRAAREERRKEVPADALPPTYSSEVESEEESSSSECEVSSCTEVSTDSEFAREESAGAPSPPAILVTEATPIAPPPAEYPLSRARSAGGLATKRALELKRKYLLGEPSPPAVRKSESTSQIETKFEAFRSNITEFQKMLNPAPQPIITQVYEDKKLSMPDIINRLIKTDASVDLLTKTTLVDSTIKGYISEKSEPISDKKETDPELDSDSLSDDTSHTETAPKSVPRVEVHDEGGELIQLDSLMMVTEENEKASGTGTATGPTVLAADSESSESGRDATTLALTETELSDWAADGALDDAYEERKRSMNPRTLSGPKLVHDAKNIAAVASHICGRTSPEPIVFSNALEHFEFADEGEPDPTLATPATPRNDGYMELVDDYEYSPGNDRSMNFIERSFSETVVRPPSQQLLSHMEIVHTLPKEIEEQYSEKTIQKIENESEKSSSDTKADKTSDSNISSKTDRLTEITSDSKLDLNGLEPSIESLSITEVSPPSHAFTNKTTTASESFDDISPPLIPETPTSKTNSIFSNISFPPSTLVSVSGASSMRLYSPAICRSASETFNHSPRSTDSPSRSFELSVSVTLSSGSISPISPIPPRDTTDKVQEIKRERDEQTEVVRRLVLERLGSGPRVPKKTTRRTRISPSAVAPPPVPPPPILPEPPAPPRPAPPLIPLPVTPSFSDPELARERRRKSIMKSISNYLNRHLGPRQKEPPPRPVNKAHKSTGALQAPPVPPPPACYSPPEKTERPHCSRVPARASGMDTEERDAMQLWFEARWARLVAQRRARDEPHDERARRLQRLERRLARPLSAEQQAATVAELVQVSAQRDAHIALMKADRIGSAANGGG